MNGKITNNVVDLRENVYLNFFEIFMILLYSSRIGFLVLIMASVMAAHWCMIFVQTCMKFSVMPFPITPALPFNDFIKICSIDKSIQIPVHFFSVLLTVC